MSALLVKQNVYGCDFECDLAPYYINSIKKRT